MNNVRTAFTLLKPEEKTRVIKDIIAYFLDERDEELGLIAASNLCDFIEQKVAPRIYDQALEDAKATLKEEFEQLDWKLSELKKS